MQLMTFVPIDMGKVLPSFMSPHGVLILKEQQR